MARMLEIVHFIQTITAIEKGSSNMEERYIPSLLLCNIGVGNNIRIDIELVYAGRHPPPTTKKKKRTLRLKHSFMGNDQLML